MSDDIPIFWQPLCKLWFKQQPSLDGRQVLGKKPKSIRTHWFLHVTPKLEETNTNGIPQSASGDVGYKVPYLKCFYTTTPSKRNKSDKLQVLSQSQRHDITGMSETWWEIKWTRKMHAQGKQSQVTWKEKRDSVCHHREKLCGIEAHRNMGDKIFSNLWMAKGGVEITSAHYRMRMVTSPRGTWTSRGV